VRPVVSRLLGWGLAVFTACMSADGRPGELRSIGVSLSDLGNPFFVRIARGVENAARRLAGKPVRVTVVSSAYDLQRQIAQIDEFIARGVDLIVLTAAEPLAIEPAVQRAHQAGIKVIAVDVKGVGADITITTDNVQAGQLACAYLAKQLNGRGNVVIINGPPVSAVVDRVYGCEQALAAYGGVRLLSAEKNGGGSREGGLTKMTDLLTAFPKIDGVFAINDMTAIGAELAARQAKRENFLIVSVDGAPSIERRLKDTNSLIAASSAQSPDRMAELAVEFGYAMLHGEHPAQDTVLIPSFLVTKENVGRYQGWSH
jgi:ribose transport system substrate-binding protein